MGISDGCGPEMVMGIGGTVVELDEGTMMGIGTRKAQVARRAPLTFGESVPDSSILPSGILLVASLHLVLTLK